MANIIALAILIISFVVIAFLVLKKLQVLAELPEQIIESQEKKSFVSKQDIFQKTLLIKQAVLHNRKVEGIMAKAGANQIAQKIKNINFKAILVSRKMTPEEMEKVEKIHQEGDYWQKVEQHKAVPVKKKSGRKKKEQPKEILPE